MSLVRAVNPTDLIEDTSKELQQFDVIKAPDWAQAVKTGSSRERPPARSDWWHVRSASILRKIALKGPIGVSKLRTLYGGKKNRGHKPEEFRRASGNILRKILQQLEAAELVKQEKKDQKKGRRITSKGSQLLSKVAEALEKAIPTTPTKPAPKPEAKAAAPKKEQPAPAAKKQVRVPKEQPARAANPSPSTEQPKAPPTEQRAPEKKQDE